MDQDTKPDVKPELKPMINKYEDEELTIESAFDESNVWSMKIPRFLLEQWERVTEQGVELGTLVVDNNFQPPKISLRLPDTSIVTEDDPMNGSSSQPKAGPSRRARYDTSAIPDEYEVNVPEERAKNTYIFSETVRKWGPMAQTASEAGKRKKQRAQPKLVARVAHECTVKPVGNQKYLKILQQRQLEAQSSRRPVVQLENTGISRAIQNQMAGGLTSINSEIGKGFIQQASRPNAGERFARLERPELTDRLFSLFSEKPYWSIKALRDTLKQPDVWIREVLKEIAEQVKEGSYINLWKLKDVWNDTDSITGGGGEDTKDGVKGEEGSDEEEDEDDDPEMEEVMA